MWWYLASKRSIYYGDDSGSDMQVTGQSNYHPLSSSTQPPCAKSMLIIRKAQVATNGRITPFQASMNQMPMVLLMP